MRAAVTRRRWEIGVEAVEAPRAHDGDALIEVSAVGICGTDLHIWDGHRADIEFPVRQGHEIGGTVLELPQDYVGPLEPGDVVAVDPAMPCGQCRPCSRGRWASCAQFRAIGVALPGGLADLVAVPTGQLHATPGLSAAEAALVEPLSIAAMAMHRSELIGGERLLVAGAGPIGLALTVFAVRLGMAVMVTDPVARRRELARDLGADRVFDPTVASQEEAVAEWTAGEGVDVALEASGTEAGLRGCLQSLGRGGRLVIVGVAVHDLVVPVPRVLVDGISVVGARAGRFPEAVAVATEERLSVRRLVTHTFSLDRVDEAFTFAHEHADDAVKVLVTCGSGGWR